MYVTIIAFRSDFIVLILRNIKIIMLGTNNFNPYQKEILKTTHSKYKLYDITHFNSVIKSLKSVLTLVK